MAPSGTQSRTISASFPSAPRPNGPITRSSAPRMASARARPNRPAPTIATPAPVSKSFMRSKIVVARGWWLRVAGREQRAESREQRGENREQRAESREQRAESREQRAESREQRVNCTPLRSTLYSLPPPAAPPAAGSARHWRARLQISFTAVRYANSRFPQTRATRALEGTMHRAIGYHVPGSPTGAPNLLAVLKRLLLSLILVALATVPAAAQNPTPPAAAAPAAGVAVIRGAIIDSLHDTLLRGALVRIENT